MMQTATEKSKLACEAIAHGLSMRNDKNARNIFLAATCLNIAARNAEHQSFMLLSSIENKSPDFFEYEKNLRGYLREVQDNLKFLGSLLNDDAKK